MTQLVSTERRDAVAVVTIDNPPLNALSAELLAQLAGEVATLEDDAGVRAVVVRGAGERAFVAGADIREFPGLRGTGSGGAPRDLQALTLALEASRLPFVAALHGYCLGGGLELAMACDVRLCAAGARLGQPEIKLGLIPGGGGTQRLPRLVGHGRAMLLNLTGEHVDAETAAQWGLVDRVVPDAALDEEALALATTIAAQSPHAVAVLKEVARATRDARLVDGLAVEAEGFQRCLDSADGTEGIAAFLEKRAPSWSER
jgi:enoyl-CoA hydratase